MLRAVVDVLRTRAGFGWAGIALVDEGPLKLGSEPGEPAAGEAAYPVVARGDPVGELRVAPGPTDDPGRAFVERVALLISPYCLR